MTEQNAPGVDGGVSAVIYAVSLEDEEDGASAAARDLNQSSVYYDADPVPSGSTVVARDGLRPAVGEVFYDAFGGGDDNNDNDSATHASSPSAPRSSNAIYTVSAKTVCAHSCCCRRRGQLQRDELLTQFLEKEVFLGGVARVPFNTFKKKNSMTLLIKQLDL